MKNLHPKSLLVLKILLYITLTEITLSCQKYPLSLFENRENLFGEYLGEIPPDLIPQRFCAQFFTDELHTPPVFSPDGMEVYWKPMSTIGYAKIFEMKLEESQWTKPFYASFNFKSINDAPFITRDGERLYFLSSEESTFTNFDENIYYVTRSDDDWSDPKIVSDNINDYALHWGFSVSDNYNIYFQDAESHDIYFSKFFDGEYLKPEKMPEAINSATLMEGTPFIAPDESYVIFDRRVGGYTDLFISFKDNDNNWTEAVNMGPPINTAGNELYAQVTADNKYLFFLRMTNAGCFPYWVNISVLTGLRPK